jgi:hypothetical protein
MNLHNLSVEAYISGNFWYESLIKAKVIDSRDSKIREKCKALRKKKKDMIT